MKKIIMSILVFLTLSFSVVSPSHAYWKNINGTWHWCTYGGTCR